MHKFDKFHTMLPQIIGSKNGPVAPTMTASAAFGYENAEDAEGIFCGEVTKPLYARMGNPTNAKLEHVISQMEGAYGAIATASGMGAISMVMSAYLKSGDKVLCIGGFFGGTYALLTETLPRFGIETIFVDTDDLDGIKTALADGISIVLVESIGNPSLQIVDFYTISELCTMYQTLLMIDNTATPLLLQPFDFGADIVVYSTTKNISGHSASLGGIAVFREVTPADKLYNSKYAHLHPLIEKAGEKAMVMIAKKRGLRDFGMSANAFGSFMTLIGLETLPLRIERVSQSAQKIASTLSETLTNITVRHPALRTHEHHERFNRYFPLGCGSLLTIDAGTKTRAFTLLNHTKLITQTANIGDNRTLALHMKSTIYRDFDAEGCNVLGITDGLIRVSIGLENPNDIIEDFINAYQQL